MATIRLALKPYASKADLEQQIKNLSDCYAEIIDRTIPADLNAQYMASHFEVNHVEFALPELTVNYTVLFSMPDTVTDIYPEENAQRKLLGHLQQLILVLRVF